MRIRNALALSILVAGSVAVTAHAQSYGHIISAGGRIEMASEASSEWRGPNLTISNGEKLRTGQAAFASVALGEGKALSLGENTEVHFRQFGASPRVRLERGKLRVIGNFAIVIETAQGELSSPGGMLEAEIEASDTAVQTTLLRGSLKTSGSSAMTFRAAAEANRTITAGGRQQTFPNVLGSQNIPYQNLVVYAGYVCMPNTFGANAPGYPGQIVPPMSDPLRPPVHYPANPFPR
jgi:hypothetical protein